MNLLHLVLVFWRNFFQFLAKMGAMQLVLEAHYKDFLQDMKKLSTMFSFKVKIDAYVCVKFLSCIFWCGGRMPHPMSP
jgi:hypothetical protein